MKSLPLSLISVFVLIVASALHLNAKPNILVIMLDDAGYNDFGFQGNAELEKLTPEIDRLAKSGMIFDNGYVSSAVCGPSRAGFLTGRYQQSFGYGKNYPGYWGKEKPAIYSDDSSEGWRSLGLPQGVDTIGDVLQTEGYRTGIIGKWHMGFDRAFHLLERGFDYFYGFVSGARNFFPKPEYETTQEIPFNFNRIEYNDAFIPESELTYLTDNFSEKAVEFIQSRDGKPWFLFISYNAPHTPLQATDSDIAHVKSILPGISNRRATYLAMIYAVDRGVGEISGALDDTNQANETMIVFLSDNGGTAKGPSDNAPLRGSKFSAYEAGTRVPFFIRWPKVIAPGREEEAVISTLDLLPTFLTLAGGAPGIEIDGADLSESLMGGFDDFVDRKLFWKELTREGEAAWMRSGNAKYIEATKLESSEMYDLNNDAGESKEIGNTNPELETLMKSHLDDWAQALPPRLW